MGRRLSDGERIWRTYQRAKETEAKKGRRLSAKAFLDAIDPKGNRSEASASRYLRKLRTGERTGSKIYKDATEVGGHVVNIRYEVAPGDIRSANVRLPSGRSRLDQWMTNVQKALRDAANRYLEREYGRRTVLSPRPADRTYVPIKSIPRGARYQGMVRLRRTKYIPEAVRFRRAR